MLLVISNMPEFICTVLPGCNGLRN